MPRTLLIYWKRKKKSVDGIQTSGFGQFPSFFRSIMDLEDNPLVLWSSYFPLWVFTFYSFRNR